MRVLLAIDESESAQRAAQLVSGVRWPSGSVVRVLAVIQSVFDPAVGMPGLAISPDVVEDLAASVLAEAERVARASASTIEARERTVEAIVSEGRPASVIVDTARQFEADLIVVGSHGRGPIAGTFLGTVSAEVAESAPCSVLVVRRDTISSLVLADDRSEESGAARRLVATMPGFRGLAVAVMGVADRAPEWYASLAPGSASSTQALEDALRDDRRDLAAYVEREAQELNGAGLVATAHVRDGDPGTEIVALARERDANLIVMGSRGRTQLASIVLGSVSRKVLSHASCSVLIVRARKP
jgi:nucleotide-binding universal stress UspA family protein